MRTTKYLAKKRAYLEKRRRFLLKKNSIKRWKEFVSQNIVRRRTQKRLEFKVKQRKLRMAFCGLRNERMENKLEREQTKKADG